MYCSKNQRLLHLRGLFFILVVILTQAVGCATYQDRVHQARNQLANGEVQKALDSLKVKAHQKSDDQLVYVLDYATALQFAGQIDESNKYFLLASELAEEKDYNSLTRVTGSMLFNEEMVQYKGDSFEKTFIHVFLALNFLQQRNYDSAMVEVRRMNEKFNKYRLDGKKNFEQNPFSRYLAGLIYESTGQMDDAFIAYNETFKLAPEWNRLPDDLLRTAILSGRESEVKRLKSTFPEREVLVDRSKRRSHGFLRVIYLQGWGPRKKPDPYEPLVPTLVPVYNQTQKAQLIVNGNPVKSTEVAYNTSDAAIQTLMADRPSLIARRVAARIAREAVARELARKDETAAAGLVSFIVMQASERADLRQWSFLPATIQIAEVQLPAGEHEVTLQGLDLSGAPTLEKLETRKVVVRPGQSEFLIWRSLK
jgi:hypothetical protein